MAVQLVFQVGEGKNQSLNFVSQTPLHPDNRRFVAVVLGKIDM